MTQEELAIIENTINKAFKEHIPLIVKACSEKDDLMQAKCKAYNIFSDKENVKDFYNVKDDLDNHIEKHKDNEVKVGKRNIILGADRSFDANTQKNLYSPESELRNDHTNHL